MKRLLFLFCLLPAIAGAKCADNQDYAQETATYLTLLINAQDETSAAKAADGLWKIWLTAPDPAAQDMLDFAIKRREAYDFEMAENLLDELIAYCPTYPEAYNQRAFARFLRENYVGALEDITVVLKDVPYHFGALSGRALAFFRQGQMELGQLALRKAIRVHPFLRERSMIVEGVGDDI